MLPRRTLLFSLIVAAILCVLPASSVQFFDGESLMVPGQTVPDEAVASALDRIAAAYASRDIMRMMDCLDRYFEKRLTFQSDITRWFFNTKEPELRFTTSTILSGKWSMSVRLRWYRKWRSPSGAYSKAEGESQFVFKPTERGLKLLYVRGDNPFF